MFDELTTWLSQHAGLMVVIGILSFLLLAASLLATPWLLARLPSDYFSARPERSSRSFRNTAISLIKTVAGVLLILLGFLMMLTPGPGLVLLVLGLALCDFPGKHTLLTKLVRQPSVLSALNWIRSKSDKPPFIVPPER